MDKMLTFSISPELLEQVRSYCEENGIMPCRWIRKVIDKAIKEEQEKWLKQ